MHVFIVSYCMDNFPLLVHVTDDSAHSVPAVYCVLQDHAIEDSLFSAQMAPQLGCSLPGPF